MFAGAYHGIFNEVINRGKKDYTSLPAAPGIPRDAVKNMLVFDYGEQESLDALKERGAELAAIIVEPVQSRAPELQPKAFLHQLREIADQFNIVLIFDEVVTGFRTCMGGAQEYFGIKADLGTYGKVLGGGWPIGVIAGKAEFMDALDGGHWQYGDDSIPEVGVTYFAGTFVRHPPALAAAKAVLTYLNNEGPELQIRLNQRCSQLVDQLNANFAMLGAPLQVHHFTTVMKLEFTEEIQHEELLFYLMREKGVHVWHQRPFFLTTAHTDEDIEFIVNAFKESVKELQQADLLPNYIRQIENEDLVIKADSNKPPVPGARLGKNPEGNPAWFIKDPERPGKFLQIGG
jgi:glutamate-1-semialdehyde aminotransferase